MTRPTPKEIKAIADVAGVPVSADVAERIANSIGPAFEGFAAVAGTLPFDLEPATFVVVQAVQVRKGRVMSTEPALMSLTAVAQAIAQKRLSSREATQSCLDRIARCQPRLNAFMAIEADEALKAADAADAALAQGQRPRRAARRAAGAQGHVLRRGQGRHLRLADPPRFRRHHDLDGVAAPEGCRHGSPRHAADGRVRLRADRPQRALRRGA